MMASFKGAVILVEDDASLRQALRRLLVDAGHEVQAYASAEEYMAAVDLKTCHCLLLDVRLPGASGVALQEWLVNANASVSVVFMTGHGSIPAAVEAMRKGAEDYLTKPIEEGALIAAVEKALRRCGEDRDVHEASRLAKSRLALLTPRERDVLQLVVSGMPNKAIADELEIALPTVKIHRGRVMEKMEAESLVDLVELANRAAVKRYRLKR